VKVSDYVPNLYKNNLEMFNIINSEEQEFELNLKPDIDNSFNNTFISKANEKGIEQYEQIFNIKADPNTETIDFRRQRILSRLISNIPFTERYMVNVLNSILGEGTWNYEINYNDYTLTINSNIPGRGWLTELYQFLKRTIPCNIQYEIIIYAATWQLVTDNYDTWEDIYDSSMTWQQVMDAEWINN